MVQKSFTKSDNSFKHGEYTTINNLVISPKIVKTDNKKKKRNREQEFNDDDKLPYFYEHWLN